MTVVAKTITTGKFVDFSDNTPDGYPASFFDEVKTRGFDGVALNVYSQHVKADAGLALERQLMVVLYQGYYEPAWRVATSASARANEMVAVAKDIGYPEQCVLFLDAENMLETDGTTLLNASSMIPWLNDWDEAVYAAGFHEIGKYVGVNCPLTGEQWYADLPRTTHYWKSASSVPDVAVRGYQMVQTAVNQSIAGYPVDFDTIQVDEKGGTVVGMASQIEVKPVVEPTPTLHIPPESTGSQNGGASPKRIYEVVWNTDLSLEMLAQNYGTSVSNILSFNGLQNAGKLFNGLVVRVPVY